jgi:hypothetical protein
VLQLMDFGQLKDPLPLTKAIADTVRSLGPDLSKFAVELDDLRMDVLELFPDAPLKRLHVIVQVLFPGDHHKFAGALKDSKPRHLYC